MNSLNLTKQSQRYPKVFECPKPSCLPDLSELRPEGKESGQLFYSSISHPPALQPGTTTETTHPASLTPTCRPRRTRMRLFILVYVQHAHSMSCICVSPSIAARRSSTPFACDGPIVVAILFSLADTHTHNMHD